MISLSNPFLTIAVFAATLCAGSAWSAGDKVGENQQCIYQKFISDTPIVDDKTILVKMTTGGYKRIDLAGNCHDLKLQGGFTHGASSTDQFCSADTLRVRGTGVICKIDKIVTIDKAEYKRLLKRK